MSLQETLDSIPAHLRQYIVKQDYSAYDEIDQAVWRFTLLQTYNQLNKTAHESYLKGLEQTGIFLDRIPRIEEMNACLNKFGWSAVCVDGFIPPRAFQEFQSLKIMTIAADIRTANHLAYTPAPDIIHESAGHSPIIPDPVYREYLRRFGELSKKAWSSKEDLRVYDAIRHLSVVKENPNSSAETVRKAEEDLARAIDNITFTSESALLSRLHWWTVEYGLIGEPEDYKIYGAGILSSVGESFMLHLPEVKKRKLRTRCVEMDYDITEQQPQLYVVDKFETLNHILDDVVKDFSFMVGGKLALQRAVASGEVGTVELNSGLQIIGMLDKVWGDDDYLSFKGPCALSSENTILEGHGKEHHPQGYGAPLGCLENGLSLSELTPYGLDRLNYDGPGSALDLTFRSGVKVTGNLDKILLNEKGKVMLFTFSNCLVTYGEEVLFQPEWGVYDMAIGEQVTSAYAGPADDGYWPESSFSEKTVPAPKVYSPQEQQLLELYQSFEKARAAGKEATLENIEKAWPILRDVYPDHWLLPWFMLEALTELDCGVKYVCKFKDLMLIAESKKPHEIPVTMGLKYLELL